MVKKIEWAALAFASLVVLFFSLNWAIQTTVHFQQDVIVPDLTGKSLLEALDTLSKLNLGLKQEGAEFNEMVPVGTVLRQQPAPGMSVREGKVIRAVLSQGGESIFTPDLKGQSLRSAEIALRLNNLSLGEVRAKPSLKFEKDVVISQEPAAKTILQKNTLVHLVVSDGPPEEGILLMPDFVGKTFADVEAWANDLGIKVERSEEDSLQETGTVLRQSIAADSVIQKESTIQVTAAKKTEAGPDAKVGPRLPKFHFEVPQGAGKEYAFVLVDGNKTEELWKGSPEPGSKLDIPLNEKVSPAAKVRILVNGVLAEERTAR